MLRLIKSFVTHRACKQFFLSIYLLYQLEHLRVAEFHVSRQLPRQVYHWNKRFVPFQLIPFVPFDGHNVLSRRYRANIPRDIVTPALRMKKRQLTFVTAILKTVAYKSYKPNSSLQKLKTYGSC